MPAPILTEKLIEQMAGLIKEFMPIEFACKVTGINQATHYNYIKRAKEIAKDVQDGHPIDLSEYDQLCSKYFEAITKADGACFREGVSQIKAHGKKDWKASARLMEAKYPGIFGRNVNLNVQRLAEKLAGEVEIDLDEITDKGDDDA